MAGLVSRPVLPLAGRTASAGAASYALEGLAYDVAIAGLPFLTAISEDRPYTRGLAPVKKEQFDNQREPGEQSLADWWFRTQASWVGGAGLIYQDPDLVQVANLQNKHAIQFADSAGVNPWSNGKFTLLRKTTQRISDGTGNAHLVMGWSDGTDRFYSAVGAVLKSDDGTTTTTITWGGAGTILALTGDGTNYYAADATGIYKGAGSGAGALVWNTGSSRVAIGWIKGRLMAGIGASVYELTAGGPALPTAKFTHLNGSWTWSAFADGTDAIYAAGYAGNSSAIYKFVLDTSGNVPTLASGGVITAQLPLGEVVYSLITYLGTFVGIGTSRGVRVGQIDSNGDIVYGPLIVTTSSGVKSLAAYDRFLFAAATNAIGGQSGLWRIDLGQPVSDYGSSASLRYAYATDLQAHVTGAVTGVSNFGTSDRMVFAVVGQGAYLEHATQLESTGTLTSGRIRFNTQEPKLYKFVSVKMPSSQRGSMAISVIEPGGSETSIISTSEGGALDVENVALAVPSGPAEWIQLKFTLGRSTVDTSTGGEVDGWQLKALPGTARQRLITIPLSCFDVEKDRNGVKSGYKGRSRDRLEAIEAVCRSGDTCSFQDLANDEALLVVIDDYQFLQRANPGSNQSTYGGYLTLQLRTVADVISS